MIQKVDQLVKNEPNVKTYFEKKKLFNEKFYPEYGPKPVDFYNRLFALYGKVDENGHPIVPKKDKLIQLGSKKTVMTLPFVKEAFDKLSSYYVRSQIGLGLNKSNHLSSISAVAGSEVYVQDDYNEYIDNIFELFNEYLLNNQNGNKCTSIEQYMSYFIEYYIKNKNDFPVIFYSTFVKSYQNPLISTGLVIDTAKRDGNNDQQKYLDYVTNNYFDFYRNTAFEFGFIIDKNNPWRLVFDITNKLFLKNKNITLEEIFDDFFEYPYNIELNIIMEKVFVFYNNFVEQSPNAIQQNIVNGKIDLCILPRKIPTKQNDSATILYGWYQWYFKIRLIEEGITMIPLHIFDEHVKKICNISQYLDFGTVAAITTKFILNLK